MSVGAQRPDEDEEDEDELTDEALELDASEEELSEELEEDSEEELLEEELLDVVSVRVPKFVEPLTPTIVDVPDTVISPDARGVTAVGRTVMPLYVNIA